MPIKKLISLHPKLTAVLDGIFLIGSLWLLGGVKSPLMLAVWFSVRVLWLVLLTYCMYYPPTVRQGPHLASLIFFHAGMTGLLLVINQKEAATVPWYLAGSLTITAPVVSFWLVPERADTLSVVAKPQQRVRFFMSVVGLAGLWSAVNAMVVLQISARSTMLLTVTGMVVVTAATSIWWWREYGAKWSPILWSTAGVLLLILAELAYITILWPLGYLVSAFLITWWWYIVWLQFRFFLSPDGIQWKKQTKFLVFNLALMAIYLLFIVRWK